jgi:hypothetical protein
MTTLDLTQGVIEIDDLRIAPGLRDAAFRATEVGGAAEPWVANVPHRSYALRPTPQTLLESDFGIVLAFTEGALRRVHLELAAPPPAGQDPWSQAWQERVHARHDRWLERAIGRGPPYRYRWGEVRSFVDAKAGFALIGADDANR